jgi:hypothetical protein
MPGSRFNHGEGFTAKEFMLLWLKLFPGQKIYPGHSCNGTVMVHDFTS